MTNEQKVQITMYRKRGLGYKQIAKEMKLPVNSVKSFCKRNGLSSSNLEQKIMETVCEYCGKSIEQKKGRKHKRFCSDPCRNRWWNSHLNLVKRKAHYEYVCPACKTAFSVYGNANRKYCSHACYIRARFGKG